MSITVYQKADPIAVERFYIQHQEEDRENLAINLDGLVRTYLQTKTKAYIDRSSARRSGTTSRASAQGASPSWTAKATSPDSKAAFPSKKSGALILPM
jgi:hypothetical protein